jgi:hypothetical protein
MGATLGNMPTWYVKTKEMAAFDRYFSMVDVDADGLLERYRTTLERFEQRATEFFRDPDALTTQWKGRASMRADLTASIDEHFMGDWVHESFGQNPHEFAAQGGKFWPNIASSRVIDGLREGVTTAIHKAMGDAALRDLGMDDDYCSQLWKTEREHGMEVDDGVRPCAMSWLIAQSRDDDFFETGVVRGPTVVELVLITPKPADTDAGSASSS